MIHEDRSGASGGLPDHRKYEDTVRDGYCLYRYRIQSWRQDKEL